MKKKEYLQLEILYDEKEELDELLQSEDFHELLYEEAIKVISESVEEKTDIVKLAHISNIDHSVMIHKPNFKPVLNKILKFYEKKEDYDKCSKIVKLKEQL